MALCLSLAAASACGGDDDGGTASNAGGTSGSASGGGSAAGGAGGSSASGGGIGIGGSGGGVSCPGGKKTTVSGTIYAPTKVSPDPLPNVAVYVPAGAVKPSTRRSRACAAGRRAPRSRAR